MTPKRKPPKHRPGWGRGKRRSLSGEVLDVCGAAGFYGASEHFIRARVAAGLIPYHKWGGRITFLRAELAQFHLGLPGVSLEQARENAAARSESGAEDSVA